MDLGYRPYRDGRPVIAYTTLPEETQHFYNRGIWTGNRMEIQQICSAGSAVPRFGRQKQGERS
jgi:hypothetical protein